MGEVDVRFPSGAERGSARLLPGRADPVKIRIR